MANVKKLTAPQIAAMRLAAKGDLRYHPIRAACGFTQATIEALRRRGLIGNYAHGSYEITPAGRQALFEATGEN